jgi:hypothetical protein
MKTLIANGCSHTAGTETNPDNVKQCPERAWAKFVADHYTLGYINLAEPGAGNEQISRSTILFISNLIDNKGVDPKDLVVTILWSGFNRYEYWSEQFKKIKSFALTTAMGFDPGETVRKYIEYRSLVEPKNYSYYKNLYYVFTTAKFLEGLGIKYYFANGLESFLHPGHIEDKEIKEIYCEMLDLYGGKRIDNHLAFFDNNNAFRSYLQSTPRSEYGNKTHWDMVGQKKYAEFFIKHMEKVDADSRN